MAKGVIRVMRMSHAGAPMASRYLRGPVGLALFMAWITTTFYSRTIWSGTPICCVMEFPWLVAMAVAGVVGVGCLSLARRGRFRSDSASTAVAWASAALCAVGTFVVAWNSGVAEPFVPAVVLGCVAQGVGFAILTIEWGGAVSTIPEDEVEFAIPISFILSSVIRTIMASAPSFAGRALTMALPLASVAFLARMIARKSLATGEGPDAGGRARPASAPSWKVLLASLVMLMAFRFEYAFIRSIVPDVASEGFGHLVTTLLIPVTFYAGFIVLALRNARAIDIDLVLRWILPLLLLTFALTFAESDGWLTVSVMGNTIASTSLQSIFWIVYAKSADGDRGRGCVLFACYATGLAFGVSGGTLVGSAALSQGWAGLAMPSMLAMAMSTAVIMASWGEARLLFAPRATAIGPSHEASVASVAGEGIEALSSRVEKTIEERANAIAHAYGLTPREREVTLYLLSRRSRLYIRDRLYISLNTVNTHVRNIYKKVGIGSLQELIDLSESL